MRLGYTGMAQGIVRTRHTRRAPVVLTLALLLCLSPWRASGEEVAEEDDEQYHETWWASQPDHVGYSAEGSVYQSTAEAWEKLLNGMSSALWYKQSIEYWEAADATNDGVMQGYEHLHEPDVRDSRAIILRTYELLHGPGWLEEHGGQLNVLEVGAGIGRLTRALLLPLFGSIVVTEPSKKLITKAEEANKEMSGHKHKVTQFHNAGLLEFEYKENTYDMIWIQWVLLYITDDDMALVLGRIVRSLRPGGVVFVKENVADKGFVVDEAHGSMTRNAKLIQAALEAAGLEVITETVQTNFDNGLYEVHMWSLRRKSDDSHNEL